MEDLMGKAIGWTAVALAVTHVALTVMFFVAIQGLS
jgi:hypothetical protein